MKHNNRIFKHARYNVITNIDFAKIAPEEVPLSVKSAKEFPDRDSMMKYIHTQNLKKIISVKCAYEIGVKNGESMREVPQYGLFGHLSNKIPFIMTDLEIHGKGSNMHYNCMVEYCSNKGQIIQKKNTLHYYERKHYKWEYFQIPLKSELGQIITWYTTSEEARKPIPCILADTKANNTIKFRDKRPKDPYHVNPAPNGIKTGTTFTSGQHMQFAPSQINQKLYSVKYTNKDNQVKWITQNESQILAEVTADEMKSLIKSGDIIAK